MPVIEQFSAQVTNSRFHNDSAASSLRQTWLKVLEQTGLVDALQATRRFEADVSAGGGQALVDTPETPARKDVGSGDFFELASSASENGQGLAQTPGISNPLGITTSSQRPASPLQDRGYQVPLQSASLYGASDSAAETDRGNNARPESISHLPLAQQKWQTQKVTLLPTESGVEVWIRDTHLSTTEGTDLISGLRHAMSRLGVALVRVSLNGKPVNSTIPCKVDEYQHKEES